MASASSQETFRHPITPKQELGAMTPQTQYHKKEEGCFLKDGGPEKHINHNDPTQTRVSNSLHIRPYHNVDVSVHWGCLVWACSLLETAMSVVVKITVSFWVP